MWKTVVREYLRFSRKERAGITLLVAAMLLTCYTPDLLFYFRRVPVTDSTDLKAAIQYFEALGTDAVSAIPVAEAVLPEKSLFYFDPNTLSVAGWQQLGLSERTALTVTKYVAHGGHFREPADLQKIYGLPPALCTRLQPWVRIAKDNSPKKIWGEKDTTAGYRREQSGYRGWQKDTTFRRYSKKAPPGMIDINTADSTVWQTLPGIGPGFSRRIIAFRDRVGGFYAVEQVAECYGLPDSTFQKIQPFLRIGSSLLKKIDLNLTDEKSLAAHPYIRYKLAHLIVQYRSTHAGFREVSELRNLPLVDDVIYRKIEHYIDIKH